MSSKSLHQWLHGAGLEGLYHKFEEYGVNETNLANLQFADYDQMGIVEPPLRQKLFRLVQSVKREQPPPAATILAPTPAPAPAPAPTNLALAPTQVLPRAIVAPVQRKVPVSKLLRRDAVEELPPAAPAPIAQPQQLQQPRTNRRASAVEQPRQPVQPPPQQHQQQQDDYDDDVVDENVDQDDEDEDIESSIDGNMDDIPKIRVAVRKRPINSKERMKGESDVAIVSHQSGAQITIHEPKQKVDLTKYVESHKFVFDEVFGEESTNEEIYTNTCKPLVQFFLNKGKGE